MAQGRRTSLLYFSCGLGTPFSKHKLWSLLNSFSTCFFYSVVDVTELSVRIAAYRMLAVLKLTTFLMSWMQTTWTSDSSPHQPGISHWEAYSLTFTCHFLFRFLISFLRHFQAKSLDCFSTAVYDWSFWIPAKSSEKPLAGGHFEVFAQIYPMDKMLVDCLCAVHHRCPKGKRSSFDRTESQASL